MKVTEEFNTVTFTILLTIICILCWWVMAISLRKSVRAKAISYYIIDHRHDGIGGKVK